MGRLAVGRRGRGGCGHRDRRPGLLRHGPLRDPDRPARTQLRRRRGRRRRARRNPHGRTPPPAWHGRGGARRRLRPAARSGRQRGGSAGGDGRHRGAAGVALRGSAACEPGTRHHPRRDDADGVAPRAPARGEPRLHGQHRRARAAHARRGRPRLVAAGEPGPPSVGTAPAPRVRRAAVLVAAEPAALPADGAAAATVTATVRRWRQRDTATPTGALVAAPCPARPTERFLRGFVALFPKPHGGRFPCDACGRSRRG